MHKGITLGQRAAATFIVNDALAQKFSVHVHDGHEVVHRGADLNEILGSMGETGADSLILFNETGDRVGMVYLVWGNDPDGSDLWSDSSANPTIEAMFERFFAKFND